MLQNDVIFSDSISDRWACFVWSCLWTSCGSLLGWQSDILRPNGT